MQPFNSIDFPEEIRNVGIALSSDQNPRYCKIDPYWGTVNAVVEAARNIAATGATACAITDCLCFGNPEKPSQMAEFAQSIKGLAESCNALKLPIIAGNVSFYNESQNESIPASPIISCLGKLNNVTKTITYSLKKTNSLLFMIGERKNECGGSVYYDLYDNLGANVPKPELDLVATQINALISAINTELILSAHDISDGGIAVALAEMCFKNSIGVKVEIPGNLSDDVKLFSETGGFVIEVAEENVSQLQTIFNQHKIDLQLIGNTTKEPIIQINPCIKLKLSSAKHIWQNGLRDKLL